MLETMCIRRCSDWIRDNIALAGFDLEIRMPVTYLQPLIIRKEQQGQSKPRHTVVIQLANYDLFTWLILCPNTLDALGATWMDRTWWITVSNGEDAEDDLGRFISWFVHRLESGPPPTLLHESLLHVSRYLILPTPSETASVPWWSKATSKEQRFDVILLVVAVMLTWIRVNVFGLIANWVPGLDPAPKARMRRWIYFQVMDMEKTNVNMDVSERVEMDDLVHMPQIQMHRVSRFLDAVQGL
jgi:hypothetical protein